MKTATYAVMHFTVAIAVAYALTGSWSMALAIGIVEPFVQTFAFAVHERLWNRASGWKAIADGPRSARLSIDINKTRDPQSGAAPRTAPASTVAEA